jgi:16S rRNA (uracil1498-N3)-methyltransferase
MTAPVFFAEIAGAITGDRITLTGDEGRHAADVRRLKVGERVGLTAGAGSLLRGVVAEVKRGQLVVEVVDRVDVPRPQPRLTVVQALARGGRDEQAVESMTEVGVDQVIGWNAARNVAHWTDRTHAKWTTTSRAAAKQSRRVWWPAIIGPESTADIAARCQAADLAVVLHEGATVALSGLAFPATGEVVVVVGPEGGITDVELTAFSDAGAVVSRLGRTVLRSSTAGVAALAVINAATRWA